MPYVWMDDVPNVQSVGPEGVKYNDGPSSYIELDGELDFASESGNSEGNAGGTGAGVAGGNLMVVEVEAVTDEETGDSFDVLNASYNDLLSAVNSGKMVCAVTREDTTFDQYVSGEHVNVEEKNITVIGLLSSLRHNLISGGYAAGFYWDGEQTTYISDSDSEMMHSQVDEQVETNG